MQERAVLFVDDDEIFLQILEMSLRGETYDKHFARSAAEAFDILEQKEVHVVVVDMVMPGMGGLELLKIVKRKYPHVVCMVLSAYAQPADVMMVMVERGIYRYIAKPWKLNDDFAAIFRGAVDNYDLLNKRENIFAEPGCCSDQITLAE